MVSEIVSTALLIIVAIVAAAFLGYAVYKYTSTPDVEVYGSFAGGYLAERGASGIGVVQIVNHKDIPLNISRILVDVYYLNGTRQTLELYPYSTSTDIFVLMNGNQVHPLGTTNIAIAFNGDVSFMAVYLTLVDAAGNTYSKTVSIDTGW